ncbi:tRNA (adenosine(37)-N6)-threonylcarbamoyltransferase complex transferase subunit TsaD [Edaphobacter sp.]|uniref:tRNA (adenosine(37)-N6)-threonylcarbamoyltransferase complex transferase subunit TsaD n=1 Tax=Edaphobacter sp. TaxID=1934404 RepID=UPI002DBB6C14|nr:tRNA (adenosine(37)-N6)-threonylcarbamoyltransferase complex transferase subunit TsaD [Edaphobacter sp.]HEU5340288.1 tRNA (adenosine(37)-N6)-threonylcarbamoyltransferase complex transferase subunit TsaD [Edaphobacter sp.]
MRSTGLILGVESSCDETAAAVVRTGDEALSNVVASQMALHANYGGVVPELASREHLRNIVPVVREAVAQAGVSLSDLDAIAVTEGPGLAGALLVGITYAKALSFGLGKPLIAVNHLEGHIHAVLLEARQKAEAPMEFPLLALVVSGGHTHLYLAEQAANEMWNYRNVGRTVDDAAGEAYDKVAKLLGLGYPGGPWIDALAPHGNPRAVPFAFGQIKTRAAKAAHAEQNSAGGMHRLPPIAMKPQRIGHPKFEQSFDFSFSGIKTAVRRYVETHHMRAGIEYRHAALAADASIRPGSPDAVKLCNPQTLDLIASCQHAVVGNLLRQTFAAAESFGARGVIVSGGVAANRELRRRFQAEADRRGLPIAFPSLALSTDNAAMIAAAAWPKFVAQNFAPEDLGATPQLRLGAQ